MSTVDVIVLIVGVLVLTSSLVGIVRSFFLLSWVREDRELLGGISRAQNAASNMLVWAMYIHLGELLLMLAGGVLIVLSVLPGATDGVGLRFTGMPFVLLALVFLVVFRGELEVRTASNVRRYYTDASQKKRES